MPGGKMHLPLFEYHDPLPLDLSQVLTADEIPDTIQPGSRLVVPHHIAGDPGSKFALRLFGHGSEFASLRPTGAVKTDAHGYASFELIVDIPQDAAEGRPFDIIVEASDGNAIGLHRTAFVVSGQGDMRHDTAGESDASRDTPWPTAIFLAAVLALTVIRRWRDPEPAHR